MRGTSYIFVASAIAALLVTFLDQTKTPTPGHTEDVLAGFMAGVMSATCWALMRREVTVAGDASGISFFARNVPPIAAAIVITWLGLRSLDWSMWTRPVATWLIGVMLVSLLIRPISALGAGTAAQ